MDSMYIESSDKTKYEGIIASFNHKNNTSDLMDNLFNRITRLTELLNENLNILLKLSENLPECKNVFLDILEKTKQALMNCMQDNEADAKKINDELKRLEELTPVDTGELNQMKQSVRDAMKSYGWPWQKLLYCENGLWRYVIRLVTMEHMQQICVYLLKALPTIDYNILLIYEILDTINSNKLIIQSRIEQIKKNWSVISENIDLAKKQPFFFEDCYGLKLKKTD